MVPTDKDIMFIELAVVGKEKTLSMKQDLCNFLQAAIEGIDTLFMKDLKQSNTRTF